MFPESNHDTPQKTRRVTWVGVRLQGKAPIEIVTWRCSKCGFLESYAPQA
jgi:hypothetical protein